MAAKPLIGITSSLDTGMRSGSLELGRWVCFQSYNYIRSVSNAGGIPVLIPVMAERSARKALLDRVDGLIFSGSNDIHPKYYGEEPLKTGGPFDDTRLPPEIDLAKEAMRRDMPILGVCGGCQTLNIATGGSLYQDIYDQLKTKIQHSQQMNFSKPHHSVSIVKGTLLRKLLGKDKIMVNSMHHMSCNKPGRGAAFCATAPDGIIEAVEFPDYTFCLTVQWHPEYLFGNDNAGRLFKGFIKAAAKAME
jgi:putative glutamine amidotransferase